MSKQVIHLVEINDAIQLYKSEVNFALCDHNLNYNKYNCVPVQDAQDGYRIDEETQEWCKDCIIELATNDKY